MGTISVVPNHVNKCTLLLAAVARPSGLISAFFRSLFSTEG